MSTWKTFSRILEKKKNEIFHKDKPRKDIGLPLGLRIGAIVNIDNSTFIVNRDELGFELKDTKFIVQAYSEFTLIDQFTFHKFYISGDNGQYILIFGEDEIMLYSPMEEIVPETEDEWKDWVDENDGMLFDDIFTINEDTLSYDYINDWGEPQFYVENIVCDKYKENIESVQVLAKNFVRKITEDQKECVMISQEENDDEAYVKLMIGTNLLESDITVI